MTMKMIAKGSVAAPAHEEEFEKLHEALSQLVKWQGRLLREHACGHPQWYAENLVALAIGGRVMPTNFKDYDLDAPKLGRVQVKSRVDGTDGSYNQNRTNFGKYCEDAFDHAAIVIFDKEYRVAGAVLLALDHLLPLVKAAGHVRWGDARTNLHAKDIADDLKKLGGETK